MGRFLVVAAIAFFTLVDLFAAQAILPALTVAYGTSPATMSFAVNACTIGMAAGSVATAWLSPRVGRRSGILLALLLLAIPTLSLSTLPSLAVFAALRVAQGLCMSAAFALTLAYLGERMDGKNGTLAFAAYITGNVASNLIGRLISAGVADHFGLSANFQVFAALNLCGAVLVFLTVRDNAHPAGEVPHTPRWRTQFADPRLVAGFAIGFCLLFAFIGTFTYVNFVLSRAPLSLGMMRIGLTYFVFLPAIVTTPMAGPTVARLGVRPAIWLGLACALLGLPLLLASSLQPVLAGMVLVAMGTFFAQAIATGYVSRTAESDRGTASGIYLGAYFSGGLVGSIVLGQVFDRLGWTACAMGIGAALAIAAALTIRLRAHRAIAS